MAKTKSVTRARGTGRAQAPSPEDRERMIAEAAYFRALNRGFSGGDPVEDWLMAQREIERTLPAAP